MLSGASRPSGAEAPVLGRDPDAERWDGLVEEEGNLGRTDLMLDTALAWLAPRRWAVSLGARFPVYTQAVGAQLSTPAIFLVTVARPFDLLR